jgi:uncharacterized protein (TIRG00374 family)
MAWWTVPLLVIVITSCMFLQGYRWWLLIRPFAKTVSLATTLYAHFTGLFYSIVLPTSAAGNVVRALSLSKSIDYSISWSSSWISGILGMLSMACLSLYGLISMDKTMLPKGFLPSFLSAILILFLVFFITFSKRLTRPVRPFLIKLFPKRLDEILSNIREGIYRYRGHLTTITTGFFLSLAIQFIITIGSCFYIAGISGKLFISEGLAFLPIIEMLCISIPLTPNGIGIREALLALMFRRLGLSNEQLAVYVVLGFLVMSLRLLGGIPLLHRAVSSAYSRKKKA